jgi:AcrR family transcriptional regulator
VDAGDPRAIRTRATIIDAASSLIVADGIGALSMDRISAVAEVSRSTLYRHFDSVVSVVSATIESIGGGIAQSASSSDDPLDAIRSTVAGLGASLRSEPWGSLVAALAESGQRSSELSRLHRSFTLARRRPVVAHVRRAQESGAIRSDLSDDHVVDLLAGPIYYRHLVMHRTMTAAEVTRHVDAVLIVVSPAGRPN